LPFLPSHGKIGLGNIRKQASFCRGISPVDLWQKINETDKGDLSDD